MIQPGGSASSFERLDYRAQISIVAVADIVKRYVAAVGLDATEFAGHSLRSGLATSAAAAGASERSIMNQTGHRSVNTVRRYREGLAEELALI